MPALKKDSSESGFSGVFQNVTPTSIGSTIAG